MQTILDFTTLTKGIEYIIAIGFLLTFVVFWYYALTPSRAAGSQARERIGDFLLPRNVFFHPAHTWARPEGRDLFSLGIDDFGQKLVGRIEAIQAPAVGSRVKRGDRAWTLRVGGQSIEMVSPLDGEIVAVNKDVIQSPEEVNKDPYVAGWVMTVRNPKKKASLKGLLSGIAANRWMEEARAQLMALLPRNHLGPVLADAGPLREGIARTLESERWPEVVRAFFQPRKEVG